MYQSVSIPNNDAKPEKFSAKKKRYLKNNKKPKLQHTLTIKITFLFSDK